MSENISCYQTYFLWPSLFADVAIYYFRSYLKFCIYLVIICFILVNTVFNCVISTIFVQIYVYSYVSLWINWVLLWTWNKKVFCTKRSSYFYTKNVVWKNIKSNEMVFQHFFRCMWILNFTRFRLKVIVKIQ